jgi:hypothetical protein
MQNKGRELARDDLRVNEEFMEYIARNEDWWTLQAGVRLGKLRIVRMRPV